LISGGIGITPWQSLFGELMYEIQTRKDHKYRRIHFVWNVQNPSLIPEFDAIHWKSFNNDTIHSYTNKIIIHNENETDTEIITDYYLSNKKSNESYDHLYPGIKYGRVNIATIIQQTIIAANNNKNEVAIFGCGPPGMLEQLEKECAINDVICHTEVFLF